MQKLVIDIDKLTLMQKVEIFDEVLRSTDGDDIKITLWAHSPKYLSDFGTLQLPNLVPKSGSIVEQTTLVLLQHPRWWDTYWAWVTDILRI